MGDGGVVEDWPSIDPLASSFEGTFMAESQRSMVSIVAIIAIVILIVIAFYFVRERREPGLQIEIGSGIAAPVLVA
jgi:hypothetical protein